jgi:CheY-like chemotaxis protein
MKKILVAEDDKFLSGAYRIKLTKLGFEVQLASDGDDALTHLQTFTPDLILLDLIMPGKDGFSTLMRLKSDERWKHIPVIVASNLGQKEDIDKSIALGATDFIIKSDTSLEQVAVKINTILQIPQPQQSPQILPKSPGKDENVR